MESGSTCENVRSLMIMRPDNIGDGIIFSGALEHIRRHWPKARIDLYVQPHVRELFRHCPHVDRVCSMDRLQPWDLMRRRGMRGSWFVERTLLRDVLVRCWLPKYDAVLYPVSAPTEEGLRIVRKMESPYRAGFSGEQLRIATLEDDRNAPATVFTHALENTPENRWLHESKRAAEWLRHLGIAVDALRPVVWLTQKERRVAETLIPDEKTLGVFVGAGSVWRQWPADKWIAFMKGQKQFKRIVVLGSANESAIAEALQASAKEQSYEVDDLTGRTSLLELAACIERCAALVSNDSSGLHFAVATGVPAVGLLGGYHFGRYYPWGDPDIHRVASVDMDCFYCNDKCKFKDWRCVRDIDVSLVVRELDQALQGEPK